jgi:uncharacterized protein YbjT (DUF2867 family)
MKAFVAGATGETGRRIVAELLARNFPVRAMVRDLDVARSILPPEAELVTGDVLQPETLRSAIADSTVILCATGARPSLDPLGPYRVDFEGTKNLVDVAKEKNIEHFVLVTSLCVSQFFHPLNLFWLILVWKKQAEEYLVKSNLTYTIVRPGGLKNEDYPGAIVMRSADTIFEGSIPRQKVAQVCVEALAAPGSRQKIVEIVAEAGVPPTDWQGLFASIR